MNNRIDIKNDISRWKNMLPKLILPFKGESLIGYLLRIAYVNDLVPSALIKELTTKNIYNEFLKTEDLELLEINIDIPRLSIMLNIPIKLIQDMTLCNIRKKIYRYNCYKSKKSFKYGNLKICPVCLEERKIPQVFIISRIKCVIILNSNNNVRQQISNLFVTM